MVLPEEIFNLHVDSNLLINFALQLLWSAQTENKRQRQCMCVHTLAAESWAVSKSAGAICVAKAIFSQW